MKVQKETGTFYARKNGSSTGSWSLYYRKYKNGKRLKPELVPKLAYPEFGFRPDMTLDEARARVKQLNAERRIDKDKVRKSAERAVELRLLDKVLFPEDHVSEFLEKLTEENFGSDEHLKKIISHFNFIQKMAIELKLSNPSVYRDESKKIYKYFIKKQVSLNYSKRLLSLLNRWGKHISRKHGTFFEDVPIPKGRERSAIAEAQQNKTPLSLKKKTGTSERGVRTESDPLTPEILTSMKEKLSDEHYNWLYLTVWLGLRPEEADALKNPKSYRVKTDHENGITVISIYQSKLMTIPEPDRWKHIPLIFYEQEKCLEIIESRVFKRPHPKTIRKHSKNNKITTYGGRKNFVDLCLDRKQDFVDIAAWMGHKDTSITFKIYKQRQTVRFTPLDSNKKTSKLKIV